MNVYVVSPEVNDARLVVNRLMDQNVSTVNDEKETHIFKLYRDGCQIDKQTGAWKSSIASCQRMEEMDTDALPDVLPEYEDDADDNDRDGNTAKKVRLSSYASSSNSILGQSASMEPGTSQIYTGDFERSNLITASHGRSSFHLNIFMIPWRTTVSEILHRLFLITAGIYILVVNTESCNVMDYKDNFIRMLDSLWTCTKDNDIIFPKVIIAASTFIRVTSADVRSKTFSLVRDWIMGKPYEYQCQELRYEEVLISPYLINDQTEALKECIFRLLQKIQFPANGALDWTTGIVESLQENNTKIVERRKLKSVELSTKAVNECLLTLHAKRLIIYLHRLNPKLIVLDPEFLILSFYKLVRYTDDVIKQQGTDKVIPQMPFFKEIDLEQILNSDYAGVLIEIMFDIGLLAKAVHNARNDNIFVVSNRLEVPDTLPSLKRLPDQQKSRHTHSPILCLSFKDSPVVASAFNMIICRLLRLYPYDKQGARVLIYRDFAAFNVSEGSQKKRRLSLFYDKDNLFVYILWYSTSEKSIEPALCVKLRKEIEDAVSEVFYAEIENGSKDSDNADSHSITENRTIEYDYLIRCPDTTDKEISEEGLISLSDLEAANRKTAVYECSNHSDKAHPHEVDADKLGKAWFPEKFKTDSETDALSQPTPALLAQGHISCTKVDAQLAGKIARCIGQRWQFLAYGLRMDQPTLEKIIEDNPRNTDKAITDMLMQCVNDRQGNLTLQEVRKEIEAASVNVNWDEFNTLYNYVENQ